MDSQLLNLENNAFLSAMMILSFCSKKQLTYFLITNERVPALISSPDKYIYI